MSEKETDVSEEKMAGDGGVELPRSRVLSYVAVADSPTRVRVLAGRMMGIIGVIDVLLAATGAGWWVVFEMQRYRRHGVVMGTWPPLLDFMLSDLRYFVRHLEGLVAVGVVVYMAMAGIVFLVFARPVRKGSRIGSWLCMMMLAPAVLFWLGVAAVAAMFGVFVGFGVGESHTQSLGLLAFIPSALAVLVVLLTSDLVGFLGWIAKHPVTEKPAAPFLPTKS